MNLLEKISAIRETFQRRGLPVALDNDGDLWFERKGHRQILVMEEGDDEYAGIIRPWIWPIHSPEEYARVTRAALLANRHVKAAKIAPMADNVWASVDLLYGSVDDLIRILPRASDALQSAIDRFVFEMRVQPSGAKASAGLFQPGQVWSYRTREPEPDSRVTLLAKAAQDDETIYLIRIDNLAIASADAPEGVLRELVLRSSETALRESVELWLTTRPIESPPPQAEDEGYFTVPIPHLIAGLDKAAAG